MLKEDKDSYLGVVENFINGKFVKNDDGSKYTVYNPAYGREIAEVHESGKKVVNEAIDHAYDAYTKWSRVPVTDRIKYLFKLENLLRENFDDLSVTVTKEHGKTLKESQGEVMRAIENVQAACSATYQIMGKSNKNISSQIDEELIREPMGVFAVIAPFNFPIMVPFWFIPYAIGLGNTVIVKPSEKVPLTMQKVGSIMERAGFPPGVVSMVNGGVPTVDGLLESQKVVGISFVGSTRAGESIYKKATSNGKRAQAGTSAKNYELVMPDADLEKTIPNLISSFYGNAGERCLAGSVLVTFPENHDKVLKAFAEAASELKLGYGLDPDATMGPLIRSEHRKKVMDYIEVGMEEGSKLILDGRKFGALRYPDGYFLGPSIFDDASSDMKIVREEIFGPVASVMQVKDLDEAIERINMSQFGNAATIFTSSGKNADTFVSEVNAGNIGVNIGVAAPIAFYPFGGMKKSFFGDLHGQGGEDHVMFFTDRKVVIRRW